MFDRTVNFIYNLVRDLSNTTFTIIMAVIITLGFYSLLVFLKANKKEQAKVSKISSLLTSIFFLVVFIILINIRY